MPIRKCIQRRLVCSERERNVEAELCVGHAFLLDVWTREQEMEATFHGSAIRGLICNSDVCIYMCSRAFETLVGSFVVLISKHTSVPRGLFFIPDIAGFIVNFVACAFMLVWLVIYCSLYVYPTNVVDMNYSSLIAGGLTVIIG